MGPGARFVVRPRPSRSGPHCVRDRAPPRPLNALLAPCLGFSRPCPPHSAGRVSVEPPLQWHRPAREAGTVTVVRGLNPDAQGERAPPLGKQLTSRSTPGTSRTRCLEVKAATNRSSLSPCITVPASPTGLAQSHSADGAASRRRCFAKRFCGADLDTVSHSREWSRSS
jgi:hypothetical protein